MTTPFIMSIETEPMVSYQHGFHLGTIERTARTIVVETYHARIQYKMPTLTIALMQDGAVFDVYDGDRWASEIVEEAYA